jgi:hypothetical protein
VYWITRSSPIYPSTTRTTDIQKHEDDAGDEEEDTIDCLLAGTIPVIDTLERLVRLELVETTF